MRHLRRVRPLAITLLGLFLLAGSARAGSVGKEIWFGGGGSWPDYREKAMACARAGVGAVFKKHVTLGISGQADRDRIHYFADSSVILPAVGDVLAPYARFQIGRRDDRDDTAMGWAAGIRAGDDAVRAFVEGFGIFEPESNYGVCFGISF